MRDTRSAIETLYEIEKQHKAHLHISVIESVLAERDAGNVEFLCQLAQAIIYDASKEYKPTNERRLLYDNRVQREEI